jgi:AraC-like DNA-binding protein
MQVSPMQVSPINSWRRPPNRALFPAPGTRSRSASKSVEGTRDEARIRMRRCRLGQSFIQYETRMVSMRQRHFRRDCAQHTIALRQLALASLGTSRIENGFKLCGCSLPSCGLTRRVPRSLLREHGRERAGVENDAYFRDLVTLHSIPLGDERRARRCVRHHVAQDAHIISVGEYLLHINALYVSRWRLNRAAFWLRSSASSLAEVALQVGYQSEAGMSRAFKRCFGLSPGTYRRHCVASNGDGYPVGALLDQRRRVE